MGWVNNAPGISVEMGGEPIDVKTQAGHRRARKNGGCADPKAGD
jgi:hypothetical protein